MVKGDNVKFIISYRDRKSTYWRTKEDPVRVWQPFQAKAEKYEWDEVIEVVRSCRGLREGESLTITKV